MGHDDTLVWRYWVQYNLVTFHTEYNWYIKISQFRVMKIQRVSINQLTCDPNIKYENNNFILIQSNQKNLLDNILLWWHYVQNGLGTFDTKHHKYINII